MKKIRRYFVYLIVRLLVAITWYFPFEIKSLIGATGGWFCFMLLKNDRMRARRNLNLAFGNKFPEKEINEIVKKSFMNLGRNVLEALHIPRLNVNNLKKYVTFQGLNHLEQASKKGKGVIVITGHLGNWEFFSVAVSMIGHPTTIIARHYSNPWIDDMMKNLRASQGTKVLVRKKGYETQMMKETFKALQENGILGLLIDQYTRKGSVCVDFFGKPATAPTGPAIFAMRTGATVLPGCIIRESKYHHTIKFYPPEEVIITGNRENDILANTANFTRAIERMIIEHPSQWAWMHDRWKLKENQKLKIKNQNFAKVSAEPCSAFQDVGAELCSASTQNDEPRATRHEPLLTFDRLPIVEIYSKPDCCLCGEAKKVLMNVKKTLLFSLIETDISLNNELLEKYKEEIPIIFINGRKAFKFRVDEEELIKKLTT